MKSTRWRFLIGTMAALLLVQLCLVNPAPVVRKSVDGRSGESWTPSWSTTEEEDQNRAPIPADPQPDPAQGGEGKKSATALGPWAVAGIVVGVIGALAVALVIGLVIDRRRKKSSPSSSSEEDYEEIKSSDGRPISFVPEDSDEWRGPAPFHEPMHEPKDSDAEDEDDDDMTVLEPPKARPQQEA